MLKQQLDELSQVQRQLARVRALSQEVVRARKADFDAIKTLGTLVASENVQQGLLVDPPPVLEPVPMPVETKASTTTTKTTTKTTMAPTTTKDDTDKIEREMVGAWARAYNRSHASKIRLRGHEARLTIPDVVSFHLTLSFDRLVVFVSRAYAYGPREVSPHGQSRFRVYQALTEYLASLGQLPLGEMVRELEGYATLFSDACKVCGNVVSLVDQLPAVRGGRHVGCDGSISMTSGTNV